MQHLEIFTHLVLGSALSCAVFGCSSSPSDGGGNAGTGAAAAAGGNGAFGGFGAFGGAGSGGASGAGGSWGDAGVDAAPAKRMGKASQTSYDAKSCSEVCGEWEKLSLSCGGMCTEKSYLGYAKYGTGTSATQVELTDCNTVPAASENGVGLDSVSCCCDSPHIKKGADAPATQTCNEICAADGLGCDDEYPWSTVNGDLKAGAKVTYRSAAGSTTYGYSGCAGIPKETKQVQNTTFYIDSYTCVCIDNL